MSDAPWSAFDHPFTIERLQVTKGYTNQTTGEWVPATVVSTNITGHYDPNPAHQEQHPAGGQVDTGQARLSTDTLLDDGDRIRVWLDASGTRKLTYAVKGIVNTRGIMAAYVVGNANRREYLLVKEDSSVA